MDSTQLDQMRTQSPFLKLVANHVGWLQKELRSARLTIQAFRNNLTTTKDHLKRAEEVAILLGRPQDCQFCGRRSAGISLTEERDSTVTDETLEQFKQVSSAEGARRAEVMAAGAGFSYEDAGSISIINKRGEA